MALHIALYPCHGTTYCPVSISWHYISSCIHIMALHIALYPYHGTTYRPISISWHYISSCIHIMALHIVLYPYHGTTYCTVSISWHYISSCIHIMALRIVLYLYHGTKYHLWRRGRALTEFGWGILRERDHLEDVGVGGRIIFIWIFRKWGGGHGLDRSVSG